MMTADPGGQIMVGDWRRRLGTKTDAHLYHARYDDHPGDRAWADILPACGRRIKRRHTVLVRKGRPCYECMTTALTYRIRPDSGENR